MQGMDVGSGEPQAARQSQGLSAAQWPLIHTGARMVFPIR